ncbi:splicing factor Cactin [Anguilla rostrata]|uniref:splicing factor Cactin n=1 Tax=Anguilla rostrata TaxID=7938 RepID=UPI0030D60A00
MDSKKHRRTRSNSRSRYRSNTSRSRSRSPEGKRGRSCSRENKYCKRASKRSRSESSGSRSSSVSGTEHRSRDRKPTSAERHQYHSKSDSGGSERRVRKQGGQRLKERGPSKYRSSSESEDEQGEKKKNKKKKRQRDEKRGGKGRGESRSPSRSPSESSPERGKGRARDGESSDGGRKKKSSVHRGSRSRSPSGSPSRERMRREEGSQDRGRRRSAERARGRRSRDREDRRRRRSRDGEGRGRGSRERERGGERSRSRTRDREGDRDRDRGGETSRRRSSSRSSVTSQSSDSSDGGARGRDGGLSVRDEQRKRKEMLKALETPEEKRARRLAKKEAKERKKREKMGWSEEYMGYTNADNPFGDNNLLGTFKWQKALEKKGIGHLGEKDLKERNKRIQEENRRELQKVKQLRLEREREKAMREQELEMLQREKEAEHFKTWAEQEDNFHLHQAKLRSKIRIRDGRAKPIDLLAKYISAEDDDLAVEMHEPYTFLNGLTVTDMDDLLEDIKVCASVRVCVCPIYQSISHRSRDCDLPFTMNGAASLPGDRREGINTSVSTDVQTVFKGKTYSQLQAMHLSIETKIRAGGSNLDIGYWESLLQQVRVYMARARLRERHQDVLRQKLYKLKQEQGVESEPLFPIIKEEPEAEEPVTAAEEADAEEAGPSSSSPGGAAQGQKEEGEGGKGEEGEKGEDEEEGGEAEGAEAVLTEEDLIQQSQAEYDSGRYSPRLLLPSDLPLDTHTIDPEEDRTRVHLARRQMQVTGDASESAEDAFVRRAREGMGGDEAQFSVELPLTGKMYLWADKYRPRKPRFFNRVHTGFEWNKYNQTHYDFDNPPPKIVQGYKFNIFYPDLIDKRSTPQYFLEPSPDNRDFGVLRFHAGPPYEDIAFKIVNREWEYSHRHGFRCQFANGIFQLWFHFKRYRYRR